MTTITAIDSGSSRQSTHRLWWSAGIHVGILLLCLAISAIPPTPASAIERTHVTLIAPTPTMPPPPHLKKIAISEPKVQPKALVAELKPAPAPREFIAPARKLSEPPRASQAEIASLQPIEVAPAISLAEPLSKNELPPPPIVVGKLSNAKSSSVVQQSTATAHPAGFSNTSGSAPPPQQPTVTARAAGFSGSNASVTITETKQAPAIASGFQDAAITSAPAPRETSAHRPLTRSVEIIKKPQPAYTEEARALRLEGEVLLEVLFTASAEVRVLRVTHGLGHGLDEAAVASASHIEFRPALREGEPTDQTVTLHIRFQLAY